MHGMLNIFLEKLLFPIGDLLLGTSFIKNIKVCRELATRSESELTALQNRKLKNILEYASAKSSYYSKILWDRNEEVVTSLKKFPILTKSIVRAEELNLLTKPIKECIVYETSGSSGIATRVYVDKEEESIFRAILINWWEWTGYYLGKPILQTGMTIKRGIVKKIKDILTNTVYLNAFNLQEDQIEIAFKKIKSKKKSYYFGGYASSLYVIAQIAERKKIDIKFDGVISWGDKMFPHYQKKIEQVFATSVYENYACNEGIMIGQKVDIPYFYIYLPNVYLELIDDHGNEVVDGAIGRVIVTKLDGYAMPLIRYETGDLAVKLPREKYPMKRRFNFPLLERVIGRDTDIIKTPEGNTLIVHTFTGIFEFYREIRQFRVIQNTIDEILIEYIPDEGFHSNVLGLIEINFRVKTKSSIKIKWSEVFIIPSTKSGKPQIILNELVRKEKL